MSKDGTGGTVAISMSCYKKVVWMFRDAERILLLLQGSREMACEKEGISLSGLLWSDWNPGHMETYNGSEIVTLVHIQQQAWDKASCYMMLQNLVIYTLLFHSEVFLLCSVSVSVLFLFLLIPENFLLHSLEKFILLSQFIWQETS